MSRNIFAATPSIRRWIYSSLFAFGRIAPVCVAQFIGYLCGLAFWFFDRNGKKNVFVNIQTLMPELNPPTVWRMVRKNYVNFGMSTFELLLLPHLPEKHFTHAQVLDPFRNIHNNTMQGPLIVVTVHCNWEMMSGVLNHKKYFKQCHAVSLSHEDPHIDALMNSVRASMGVHNLLLDRAPLETLRVLKADGILALLGDRDYGIHGVERRIGGGIMKIPVGPAALSIQTQAPILPLITCRSGATRYTVLFGQQIHPDPTLSKKEQLPIILDQLAVTYQRFLRSVPTQWACFHPAFVDHAKSQKESSP